MREQNYTVKFLILFLATGAGIFAIWYALMRDESVDWLSSQIAHQVSPYVIAETADGLLISNVLMGYGFDLPEGFKTIGAKNISFYMEEAGEKKCEIKHYIKKTGGKINIDNLVFELVDKEEKNICRKYLLDIKNSLVFN
ncbi:MAG: hypothetical protein WCV70_01775 [Patescibacteria group bacterium]|jgi:hypothetical protein